MHSNLGSGSPYYTRFKLLHVYQITATRDNYWWLGLVSNKVCQVCSFKGFAPYSRVLLTDVVSLKQKNENMYLEG